MKIGRGVLALAVVAALAVAPWARAEDTEEKPDATIHLESKSVAVGVGFSWGDGTLKYKGHSHKVEVDGLTVGSVGAKSVNANGSVYHLKKLSDFDGTYAAVSANATVGGGGGVLTMKNQNGVVINLGSTSQGVAFTVGASGVTLKLKQ
jgi:hypothetical protein